MGKVGVVAGLTSPPPPLSLLNGLVPLALPFHSPGVTSGGVREGTAEAAGHLPQRTPQHLLAPSHTQRRYAHVMAMLRLQAGSSSRWVTTCWLYAPGTRLGRLAGSARWRGTTAVQQKPVFALPPLVRRTKPRRTPFVCYRCESRTLGECVAPETTPQRERCSLRVPHQ